MNFINYKKKKVFKLRSKKNFFIIQRVNYIVMFLIIKTNQNK